MEFPRGEIHCHRLAQREAAHRRVLPGPRGSGAGCRRNARLPIYPRPSLVLHFHGLVFGGVIGHRAVDAPIPTFTVNCCVRVRACCEPDCTSNEGEYGEGDVQPEWVPSFGGGEPNLDCADDDTNNSERTIDWFAPGCGNVRTNIQFALQ